MSRRPRTLPALLSAVVALLAVAPAAAAAPFVVHRVDAGGLATAPDWEADPILTPHEYLLRFSGQWANQGGSSTDVDLTHPSVPAGTPEALFDTERWDATAAPETLSWRFPVTPGTHTVRLYFAETFFTNPGERKFHVNVEGVRRETELDMVAEVGPNKAFVRSYTVTDTDGAIAIDFLHGAANNPSIKAIEILSEPDATGLTATPGRRTFGAVSAGSSRSQPIVVTNNGSSAVTLQQTTIEGSGAPRFSDDFDDAADRVLAPGASTTIRATFTPDAVGERMATLAIAHNGPRQPLRVRLRGEGSDAIPVAFHKSLLDGGGASSFPTALQWGPDGRLYVADFLGTIRAYTIVKDGPGDYRVTGREDLLQVNQILNHDDFGAPKPGVLDRLVTGLLVTGTAQSPEVYVTSSDPLIGGDDKGDLNLDTNSGTISLLKKTSGGWTLRHIVRGLPRSEENHASNGMALDPATNTLYVAQGGNTNKGAPSSGFALLPEYQYSAAILSVDLDAIGSGTHDLATLKGRLFGGEDGANQAKIVGTSPVQVHAPGFRNPYGIVRTQDGNLFTIDNGGNAGWGTFPTDCTNTVLSAPGDSDVDTLHRVTPGYYGGHPNPNRAAVTGENCTFIDPDTNPSVLARFASSTNGMDEYTASTFGGAMKGDLLAAGYVENMIFRIQRNGAGTGVVSNTTLASAVSAAPLDLDATGDGEPFPGTVWIADQGPAGILVLEPREIACSGVYSADVDGDGDGYSNADEIDNGGGECNPSQQPPDADGDKVSDAADADDDDDGRPDVSDPFAVDARDGLGTGVEFDYQWENGSRAGGLLDLGFTGLMTNGHTNYRDLFDPVNGMTVIGAAGVVTVDEAGQGDAAGALNTQTQAFQLGVDPASAKGAPFEVRTRLVDPFAGRSPASGQSLGLFVGTGSQDDYVKVVAGRLGGATGIRVDREVAGALTEGAVSPLGLPLSGAGTGVDLYLVVDPAAKTVQAEYSVASGPRTKVGGPVPIPASWLDGTGRGLAIGIISTARGGAAFPATWDFLASRSLAPPAPTPTPVPTATATATPTPIPTATPTPPPTPTGPPDRVSARLAGGQATVRVRRGRALRLRVQCPQQARARCAGRIAVQTVRRYRVGSRRRAIAVAGKAFSIAQGRSGSVTLKPSRAARRLLSRPGRVRVRVTLREPGAAAVHRVITLRVTR